MTGRRAGGEELFLLCRDRAANCLLGCLLWPPLWAKIASGTASNQSPGTLQCACQLSASRGGLFSLTSLRVGPCQQYVHHTCACAMCVCAAGLQELAPLPCPRMWTVLDPAPTPSPLAVGSSAPVFSTEAAPGPLDGSGVLLSARELGNKGGSRGEKATAAGGVQASGKAQAQQPATLAATEAFQHAQEVMAGAGAAQGGKLEMGVAGGAAAPAVGKSTEGLSAGIAGGPSCPHRTAEGGQEGSVGLGRGLQAEPAQQPASSPQPDQEQCPLWQGHAPSHAVAEEVSRARSGGGAQGDPQGESSDSEGSLPDIDSGRESSSEVASDEEMGMDE